MSEIDDPNLRLLTVWGPMLGHEKQDDAVEATELLPDPRVTHFWSPGNEIAETLRPAAGLPPGELAWDTYQLYRPGVTWDEVPPTPDFVMHVGKLLPEDHRLDGRVLADHIRALLTARPTAAPGR